MPASDVNPGNANLPIGVSHVAIQENSVPGRIGLVTRRLLRSGNVPFRLEGRQRMHGDPRIPERALRILLDLGRVESAHARAMRTRMFPAHYVRERFRVVSIFLRLLVELGENAVTSECHPDVILRIRVALISTEI